jgi:hypothetical protein
VIQNGTGWGTASQGIQYVTLATNNEPGRIEQVFDTVAGTSYTFNWDEGYLSGGGPLTLDYTIEIVEVGGSLVTHTVNRAVTFATVDWTPTSYSFTAAPATTSSTLRITALASHGNNRYGVAIDNFVLAQVPEPSSLCLLSLGGLMLLRRRARRA